MTPTNRSTLPPATRRLFSHYAQIELDAELDTEAGRVFVTLRLAEDGDRDDLGWLVTRVGEEKLRETLTRHGARQLSRRSLAFWRRVLALPQDDQRFADELWTR